MRPRTDIGTGIVQARLKLGAVMKAEIHEDADALGTDVTKLVEGILIELGSANRRKLFIEHASRG